MKNKVSKNGKKALINVKKTSTRIYNLGKFFVGLIGLFTLLFGALALFPRLTITKLSESDSHALILEIKNNNPIPISKVDIVINATSIKSDAGSTINGIAPISVVMDRIQSLDAGEPTTKVINNLCGTLSMPGNMVQADIVVIARYSLPIVGLKCQIKRRFIAEKGYDSSVLFRSISLNERLPQTQVPTDIMTNVNWKALDSTFFDKQNRKP